MSTAPTGPRVVMTTDEAMVGAGEMVPVMIIVACPEYVGALV
jgi:hypothetical protein